MSVSRPYYIQQGCRKLVQNGWEELKSDLSAEKIVFAKASFK